jgi:pimeloyl-ACP methyl ester carboxylesterase
VETKFLQLPQGKLAYSDYGGDGELVLMLPGMGALRSEYRYLAPRLVDAGYRAVTADLRGHGESSSRWQTYDVPSVGSDILSLIVHLDGPAHLIGTSFAAAAVVWAAAERPTLVRSQVLIGPFVRAAEVKPIMQLLFGLMVRNPWRVRLWTMYYRSLYPTRKPDDFDEYLRRLRENLAEPGRFDAAVALAESPRDASAERLSRVRAPTLVVMGSQDPDFADPVGEARYVARMTRGELELIQGAGHYPQTEMPAQTARTIIDFLRRVSQNESS